MKTIFDEQCRQELIQRIKTVSKDNSAQWGKMNVYQMLMHCTFWDAWIQGVNKLSNKQALIGIIFGKMALKSMMKDDKPLRKNTPTSAPFRIKELTCDLESEKIK